MPAGFRLAGLQRLAESALPDTAAVSRPTDTNTADGVTRTFSTVATVACRVQPLGRSSGNTEVVGTRGGLQTADSWLLTLPAGTDVTVRDRLIVGARTFEIAEVLTRTYEVARITLCREVL